VSRPGPRPGVTGSEATNLLPTRERARRPVLAKNWVAWVLSAFAVVVTQIVMWNGWNASGEWIPATGTTALVSYSVYGFACAVPVVTALIVLRHWLSLATVLLALVLVGARTGHHFETTTSSTAGIAWFCPLIYCLPLVAAARLAEVKILGWPGWLDLHRDAK
jgi:hypothetical protein